MTEIKWNKRQQELIDRHIREREGKPSTSMLKILEWDTDFFEHYLNISAHPWKTGHIPPKYKELIYIALDASTTHLYSPGTRVHMQRALDQGVTREEILEVLEMTVAMGIHSCTESVPILDEVYQKWLTRQEGK